MTAQTLFNEDDVPLYEVNGPLAMMGFYTCAVST